MNKYNKIINSAILGHKGLKSVSEFIDDFLPRTEIERIFFNELKDVLIGEFEVITGKNTLYIKYRDRLYEGLYAAFMYVDNHEYLKSRFSDIDDERLERAEVKNFTLWLNYQIILKDIDNIIINCRCDKNKQNCKAVSINTQTDYFM